LIATGNAEPLGIQPRREQRGRRVGANVAVSHNRYRHELLVGADEVEICGGGDYWWGPLSPDREWFEVCGNWTASVDDPQRIAGLYVGTFAYHHETDPSVSPNDIGTWTNLYCKATDHHFTLTRSQANDDGTRMILRATKTRRGSARSAASVLQQLGGVVRVVENTANSTSALHRHRAPALPAVSRRFLKVLTMLTVVLGSL
jgi:hypothetical protein